MKYKVIGTTKGWKSDAYLYEITTGRIGYCMNELKSRDYYKDEEQDVEQLLLRWNYKFEKYGETLERPVPKEKTTTNVKRKKSNN